MMLLSYNNFSFNLHETKIEKEIGNKSFIETCYFWKKDKCPISQICASVNKNLDFTQRSSLVFMIRSTSS